MKQIRTDLAMESSEAAGCIPGVSIASWEESGVLITEVVIETEESAKNLSKPMGRYITLECEGVRTRDPMAYDALSSILAEEIARLLPPDENRTPALIVGLGNRMVTPDALGPKTIDHVLVTRHLINELPDETDERLSSVCCICPGVLGVTGIETMESVKSIVSAVKPRVIICIDALAARASKRVGVSIQLSDVGIQPGSGVGNHRRAITKEELGVPVIAIGMPTVVYASTIARDALYLMSEGEAEEEMLDKITKTLFENEIGEMIVTPREIDDMIEDAAGLIARAINISLQDRLSQSELDGLLKR
ncbi:MAG: GPR endopeptidase [Clostridia bacterium]|nr:GPR endopeptidase [Clostridia bacterium]